MRKYVVAIAAAGLLLGGCSWFGWGDDSTTTAATENPEVKESVEKTESVKETAAKPATETKASKQAPAKTAAKTTSKGKKSEDQIKAELDRMGKKLAGQSSRTLLPNKANKNVAKKGSEWVATYLVVNPEEVVTEMRPGANGQYIGFIRYQEHIMECRGATKEAALKANCVEVGAKNLNELIRYDGKEWQD